MAHGLLVSALAGLTLSLHTTQPLPHSPLLDTNGVYIASPQGVSTYTYVVEKGDDLTTIAGSKYGKEDFWVSIWNDNPWITDPRTIEVGQKLTLRSHIPTTVEELKPELAARLGVPAESILQPELAQVQYQSTYVQLSATTAIPTVQPTVAQSTTPAAPSSMDAVYQDAAKKYNVPWGIIKGLHAAESNYGDGPRCNASGDCGPFQFASGTWAKYHDPAHPDQNSAVDGAYAAAKYLAEHGNDVNALKEYGTNVGKVLTVAASTGSTY